jgi:hypothetical protein
MLQFQKKFNKGFKKKNTKGEENTLENNKSIIKLNF